MVLMSTDGGPVRLPLKEEQEFLESLEEIRRGKFIDGRYLLNGYAPGICSGNIKIRGSQRL